MNIEEAIKYLRTRLDVIKKIYATTYYNDYFKSLQLGIEALEIINQIRLLAGFGTNFWASSVLQLIEKLPSETE